ncbi:glycosyltransferase [Lachnoclostridium phytofermentans]|uniref:Glycosyl transferase group 1 n=1 Tax=Lachnoclostridium phytofermentans (strain ATCC 700394 / DSM 18823 / ISDg) TaxID=357809 RepID=A9KI03_LACP7|nr:glycosyltransferase [Lachnoclostridium phytofermentans]ABX43850.1 glycosyl transferase group 1 [Lachnoclostridium phytofermentans ISDg]
MYNNLDIIFLGGLFPKEKEEDIINNSIISVQNAANNLQWEFVKGLDENLPKPIKIINSLYIGSFPKRYKKLTIDTYKFHHALQNSHDINVGFLNLPIIKNFSRYHSLKTYFKKWALNKSGETKIVIAYAMTFTFTHILRYVKRINSNIITCLIVPDLPQYMNLTYNKKVIYTLIKNIEINLIKSDTNYIDSYVLLTEYMRDALNINVPYVVIEGISTNLFDNVNGVPEDNGIKTILYSGGLNEKYGVIKLIQAFEKLQEKNYQLIICGSGDAEAYIKKAATRDKRIIFKGLLKREEVLALQKSATVLVNPRPNNEEYTKYSFPSKNLEYLSSGIPLISYRLDGIPKEYNEYIYFINEDTEESDGLFLTMKEVLEKSDEELKEKGLRAKEFVLKEKNSANQAKKLLNMIITISEGNHRL